MWKQAGKWAKAYVDSTAPWGPTLLLLYVFHAGVGGFGQVYEAVWRGQRVAVKIMPCQGMGQYQVGEERCTAEAFVCMAMSWLLAHFGSMQL